MGLMIGKFQFVYNIGNGDIRIYDIMHNGSVREEIAKSGNTSVVETGYVLDRLYTMIELYEKQMNAYKRIPLYYKVRKSKYDLLKNIYNFIVEETDEGFEKI